MKQIKLLVLDVDGVLTDGRIVMDDAGRELKFFHVRDGMGIHLLMKRGIEVAIISGRFSYVTLRRAEDLGIKYVYQGIKDKLAILKSLCDSLSLTKEEVAYVGDDLNDVECIKWAGFGVVVADAPEYVKKYADYVTRLPGGKGAVREVCDLILEKV